MRTRDGAQELTGFALEGEHDFSCFRAAGCAAATAVRRIYRNELYSWEDHWVYRIEATGYLRHMVRNIVGTLVQMGLGERDPSAFPALIRGRDRTLAGPTAPARGLFLVEVSYGPSQSPRADSAP